MNRRQFIRAASQALALALLPQGARAADPKERRPIQFVFTQEEVDVLRRFLSYGGFLLIDDALGQQGYGFDKAARREMQRILPGNDFKRLPPGHAALRSYYLMRRIGGVRMVSPALEGITVGNSTPVIYCQNDLGGAWERDQLGNWTSPCTPGGEEQRKDAFHLGINLILYAMTENYKEDLIHVPFIRKRLTRTS